MERQAGGVMASAGSGRFRVVIVGGGVAGLEAMLALSDLAGELVQTTVLAPNSEFSYRPLTVLEPFSYGIARQYPLAPIVHDAGAELHVGELAWVDREARAVHTKAGAEIPYDALLLTLGAHATPRYTHASTIDDRRMDETLRGLVQDVEEGYMKSVAFVSPGRMAWPMPLYELALMTAARAHDADIELTVTLITPEDAPLAVFGRAASDAVSSLLSDASIDFIPWAYAEIPSSNKVVIHPEGPTIHADRIVALPELYGPSVRGIPLGEHGFLPTDSHGRVRDAGPVFAAGDATEFPVKHGGVGAQQADVAAESIAALAGAPIEPKLFRPSIEGVLLTGQKPLHMSADLAGGRGETSDVSVWERPEVPKLFARYLSPLLDSRDRDLARAGG